MSCLFLINGNCFNSSVKKVNTATAKTTTTGKAVPKLPEVLLKKRKLYADLKARRLRAQVQGAKVKNLSTLL
jgi:hypothetical protein